MSGSVGAARPGARRAAPALPGSAERRRAEAVSAAVGSGVAARSWATPLVPPPAPAAEPYDPPSAAALRRFLDTYALVADLPVALSMPAFRRVYVRGNPERAR